MAMATQHTTQDSDSEDDPDYVPHADAGKIFLYFRTTIFPIGNKQTRDLPTTNWGRLRYRRMTNLS